ncbi:TRAP transporter small permease [Nesterenkonia muleiensis]|uniref:TRAP transporter small permease n=1 Tax=Nesterenkonia muleiensis TaxID=2282648 RepID=UPI001EE4DE7B|nr:TRAP transporter small permease [Nesterenkonia muleiensis]
MVKISQIIHKTLLVVTACALTIMMLHLVLNAMMRFLLDSPLYGTNEIVAYWHMPLVVLLGIPLTQLQKEHINVTLVSGRMRRGSAIVFRIFGCTVSGLASIGFAWYGLGEALHRMEIGYTAGVTAIVTWPISFVVPLAFAILAILYVTELSMIFKTGEPQVDLVPAEKAKNNTEETMA